MLLLQVQDCQRGIGETTGTNDEVYALFEEYANLLFLDIPVPVNIQTTPKSAHIIKVGVLWVLRKEDTEGTTILSTMRNCECVFKLIDEQEAAFSEIVVPKPQLIVPKGSTP